MFKFLATIYCRSSGDPEKSEGGHRGSRIQEIREYLVHRMAFILSIRSSFALGCGNTKGAKPDFAPLYFLWFRPGFYRFVK
jgi:hypothetical protein